MTYLQATNAADRSLEKSLEALNNGELSKYVALQANVDYLNELAESLKLQ